MKKFHKLSASGNDFILFDYLNSSLEPDFIDSEFIVKVCERRTGIGADGVIVLTKSEDADFRMHYYNSDGSRGEMCGNGARASFYYYYQQTNKNGELTLLSDVGVQRGEIWDNGKVSLEISMIKDESLYRVDDLLNGSGFFIDTGVPHAVFEFEKIDELDVYNIGRKVRFNSRFKDGCNVNFFSRGQQNIQIRTYERGVEKETLSCGTGVAATAIYCFRKYGISQTTILSRGGEFDININDEEGLKVSMKSGVVHHYSAELIDERYN